MSSSATSQSRSFCMPLAWPWWAASALCRFLCLINSATGAVSRAPEQVRQDVDVFPGSWDVISVRCPVPKVIFMMNFLPDYEEGKSCPSTTPSRTLRISSRRRGRFSSSQALESVCFVVDSSSVQRSSNSTLGVSCGIPDFRSRDGLYAKLKERGEYDLDDPQQMSVFCSICNRRGLTVPDRFDINYFRENPAGALPVSVYCPYY